MDISVSGGAPAKEAVATAKSGKVTGKDDRDGGKGGFSDALSKAKGDASGAEGDAAAAQETDPTLVAGHAGKAQAAHGRNATKPLIDVSEQSLKGQAAVQAEKIAGAAKGKASVKIADAGKVDAGADDATDKTTAEKFAVDGLPAKTAAHAAKGAKPTKTDAADKDEKPDTDDNAVSDVLGLLNKDAPINLNASAALAVAAHAADKTTLAATPDKKTEGATPVKAGDKAAGDVADALAAISGGGEDAHVPGTEAAEATDAKTFKISRADGRGAAVTMRGGADEDHVASKKADMENVSVLESRRYIGLAQNSNSASVTAAISGDKEWASAMQPSSALSNAAEWTNTGKVVNTLKIQMNPLDLGLVTATMRLSGDALNVDLKVETGAAYRQLKEDHGKMVEALRSQGYAVDSVTISMAPTMDKPDTSTSGGQSQTFQEPSAQQGQGGAARERNNQTQWTDGGFNGAGETGVEDASAGRAGGSSPGGVYL